MTVEELLEPVDLSKVDEAIKTGRDGDKPLKEYDVEDARRVVAAAVEKWLVKDHEMWQGILVEGEKWMDVKVFGRLKAYIDLWGIGRQGQFTLVDWKTSRNTLDEEWTRRLKDSWQWRYYAAMTGASQFYYRGISRPKWDTKKKKWTCETKQLVIDVPEDNGVNVERQLTGLLTMRQTLVEQGLEIWPQSRPGACMAFGQLCPFHADCPGEPQKMYELDMSYSSLEKFALCPERYRRQLLSRDQEGSDEALFGQAVHRGLGELYKQVWEKK